MTRDSPGRSSKPRTSLGDLTNRLGKRGFALITRSPASKSAGVNPENANKENDSELAKRISLGFGDSGSEISVSKRPKVTNPDKSLSLLKGGKTYRLHSLGNVESAVDSKLKASAEANLGQSGRSNVSQSSSESCSKDHAEIGGNSQDPEEPILEALGSQVASTEGKDCGTEGKDCGIGTVPWTECPEIVSSRLNKMQGGNLFELERCVLLKDDAASDAVPDALSLKSCCCSFCVKAAYIWSDLQYTDVKGRMSVLMKSKKEASNLVRMSSAENGMHRSVGSTSSRSSELDMDLMDRCKSLFVFMEDAFGMESSQLETEFSSIKDIRQQFKINLETLNETPPDTQQSASDDSAGEKIT